MTVDLPTKIHKKLKVATTIKGKTMREYAMKVLANSLTCRIWNKRKKPNKETLEAIKESNSLENLKTYNSAEDFFNQMGI